MYLDHLPHLHKIPDMREQLSEGEVGEALTLVWAELRVHFLEEQRLFMEDWLLDKFDVLLDFGRLTE